MASGDTDRRFPSELIRLRDQARLTQEQLAERAGISVRSLRNLERGAVGKPRWDSVRRLALALAVPEQQLARLLSGSEEGESRSLNALPPMPGDFTGRREELGHGELTLNGEFSGIQASASILNISGRPGVGKSALAIALGHRVRSSFPGGQLFVDLRGAGEVPRQPAEVLGDLLLALGLHPSSIPESPVARALLFHEHTADRQLLLVLDDAHDESQVAPLVPSASRAAVVVTSRRPMAGLPGVRVVDLDALSEPESVELLRTVVGHRRADAEPAEIVRLAQFCAGLPLALRIAGARLVSRPTMPVQALAARLADEHRRLDELQYADLEFRAPFSLVCSSVPAEQQRMLALLGHLDVATVSRGTTAALTDLAAEQVTVGLEALVDARLVDVGPVDALGETTYGLHDLVRLFARELPVPAEVRDAALLRVAGRWLVLAQAADGALPTTSDVVLRGSTPTPAVSWSDLEPVRADPFAWFVSEEENLATFIEQLAAERRAEAAWELASHLRTYAMMRNRWGLWRRTHEAALAACEAVGDRRGAACMRFGLGKLRHETHGAAAQKPAELLEAVSAFHELGEPGAEALALCELASWYTWKDDLVAALGSARRAVELARESGSSATLVDALFVLGRERARQSQWAEARAALQEALSECRPLAKSRSEAQLLWQLGVVARGEKDLHTAQQMLGEALVLVRASSEHKGAIVIMTQLAEVCADLGLHTEALRHLDVALELCRESDETSLRARVLTTASRLHAETGGFEEARRLLKQAAAVWAALDHAGRLAEVEAALLALPEHA